MMFVMSVVSVTTMMTDISAKTLYNVLVVCDVFLDFDDCEFVGVHNGLDADFRDV